MDIFLSHCHEIRVEFEATSKRMFTLQYPSGKIFNTLEIKTWKKLQTIARMMYPKRKKFQVSCENKQIHELPMESATLVIQREHWLVDTYCLRTIQSSYEVLKVIPHPTKPEFVVLTRYKTPEYDHYVLLKYEITLKTCKQLLRVKILQLPKSNTVQCFGFNHDGTRFGLYRQFQYIMIFDEQLNQVQEKEAATHIKDIQWDTNSNDILYSSYSGLYRNQTKILDFGDGFFGASLMVLPDSNILVRQCSRYKYYMNSETEFQTQMQETSYLLDWKALSKTEFLVLSTSCYIQKIRINTKESKFEQIGDSTYIYGARNIHLHDSVQIAETVSEFKFDKYTKTKTLGKTYVFHPTLNYLFEYDDWTIRVLC